MLKIIDADYIEDYKLRLTFNDGVVKDVNLKPYLVGPVFGKLLQHDEFVQYAIVRGTIEWTGGIDLAPEFLYEIGKTVSESEGKSNRLQKFFDNHREINVSGFAERIGLNPQLLSNYIRGYKRPSAEREEMIFACIRSMGEEYMHIGAGFDER